jgi:predicted ATPase/DNA-binding SARP family transcriptional activator
VHVQLLGPVELVDDEGRPISAPAGKPRALLALLALEAGHVVSSDRLIDVLWGDRPPATAPKILQGYVSRLRKLLPAGRLETREPGYVFRLAGEELDLARFERLRNEAAAAAEGEQWQSAAALLREALELWRGPPLADVADELDLPGEIARLEELHLVALEQRVAADLELGHEADLIGELDALTRAHPLRERLRLQLMLALYRLGRQADALNVYRDTRELLVDQLGIEPGPELQQLERQILLQDDSLVAAPRAGPLPPVPAPLTPIVDRVTEIAEIGGLLRQSRLVTLLGSGGVGKTRLALAFAEPRPDAVFVPLGALQDPKLVRSAITHVLGLTDEEALAGWLRRRELLLVLDNFEHLLEAGPVVTELLEGAPGVRVLTTSRAPLDVRGEHQYTISPLAEPDAVELFVQRAAASEWQVGSVTLLGSICRQVDYLPLAIELAAARVKTLPPESLLARLEQRLPLLTHGPRDLPERQRTLRATIEWSHALLTPEEQTAFARLAVFAGGGTLEAVESVCGVSLDVVDSLVDKSLLRHAGDRVSMLETIREYAREQLEASGEADSIMRALAVWLLAEAETFAEERRQGLFSPLVRLESELENIRAALRSALGWTGDPLALRLVTALTWFWRTSGRQAEGLRWTVEALDQAGDLPGDLRAHSLQEAAMIATLASDSSLGRRFGREALELCRASGDDVGAGEILPWLAHAHWQAGDIDGARALHGESIALQARLGIPVQSARAYRLAGETELYMGEGRRAAELYGVALEHARLAGATGEVVMTLHGLGDASLASGDVGGAATFYLDALDAGADSTPAANCLAGLAAAAALGQLAGPAGRIWGAVEAHQLRHGEQFIYPPTGRRYEAALAGVEGADFQAAVAAGHALTLDDAAREARETFERAGGITP